MTSTPAVPSKWPGERLGLPESGPRSVGRLGRRFIALCIDWAIASLIAWAFIPHVNGGVDPWWTLGLFAALQVLFLIVLNASPGHLVTGLRLVPIKPAPLGLWRPVVRTALSRNVLDVFNEYGVQIMTPAYRGDPEEPKIVRREDWHLPPASPAEGSEARGQRTAGSADTP